MKTFGLILTILGLIAVLVPITIALTSVLGWMASSFIYGLMLAIIGGTIYYETSQK